MMYSSPIASASAWAASRTLPSSGLGCISPPETFGSALSPSSAARAIRSGSTPNCLSRSRITGWSAPSSAASRCIGSTR